MSLTEHTRLQLHQYLEERMGPELANEVMEWLPRGALATKDDIEALRLATKADIEALRLATKAEFEGLRDATKADIEGLRAANKAEFDSTREVLALHIELSSEKLRSEFNRALRTHTLALVGTMGVLGSLARIF